MQPVFDRTTPVVDFGETPSPKSWGPRRWMLWPVYAYKVLILSRGNPPFNIFQRAVLDMCQAGIRDPEKIAELLGFPSPDLFISILDQLQSMGVLDSHRALTDHTKRLLADEADTPNVEDVGYVFVDAHSFHLWPRLYRGGLPLISVDMETRTGNDPNLTRGSEGSPDNVSARVLWPTTSTLPKEPSAFDLKKAVQKHARWVRKLAREGFQHGESSREMRDLTTQKVRFLGTDPELIFVATTIFMPKDASQSSWFAADPCGLGVSEVLRAGILKLVKDDRHGVKKMLEKLTGQALHVDDGDFALYLAEENRYAVLRIEKHLGHATNVLPTKVLEQLARADGKSQSKKTKDIETFFADAYAAIEGTFSWLVSLHPDTSVLASLAPDASNNEAFLREIAERLGFTTSEKTSVFFKTSRGVVKGALCNGNILLPGCLAAALLAANGSNQHPLVALAAKNQNALVFLADFKKRRDNASHNTAAEVVVDDIEQLRSDLFKFFRDLLGSDDPNKVTTGKEVSWGADMFLRIRSQAVKTIEKIYPGIDEYPDLHSRMIEMQEASLVVNMLTRIEDDGQELKARLKQLMVDSTIVMESIFAVLERQAPSLSSIAQNISDDRTQNATLLVSAAFALGFELDKDGKLAQALTHTKSDSLLKTARGKVNSLQATVTVQVLSANVQKEHPIREIAKKAPRFLLHIGQLIEARGHGNEVSITAAEAQEIVKLIQDDIQVVIDVIF